MRRFLIVLPFLLLALPVTVEAQQQQSAADRERRAALQARRDSLELEIVQKFIVDVTRELKLDAPQRVQLERVLKESGERRRDLMRSSGELRGRIVRSVRNANSTDAELNRLLVDHESLRLREHDLWRRDQDELAAFLTPRQRAQFLLQWAHFQERVRDIVEQRMRELRGGQPPPRSH